MQREQPRAASFYRLAATPKIITEYHGVTFGGGTGLIGSLLPELATTNPVAIPAAAAAATTSNVFCVFQNPLFCTTLV
jgi:hypothetical protein